MALSYYSNWDSIQQLDSSELLSFPDDLENPSFFLSNGVSTEFEPFHYQKSDQICHNFNCSVFSPKSHFRRCRNSPTAPPHAGSLSAQSIAARQRRRKITEKTQELGKIVPGGLKMNTAEMLQSAYKYIKFLQAQVGLLEFISSFHQESAAEDFQLLIESPLIQEKLYSTENCLIPHKFIQQLRGDDEEEEEEFKSNTHCVKKEH